MTLPIAPQPDHSTQVPRNEALIVTSNERLADEISQGLARGGITQVHTADSLSEVQMLEAEFWDRIALLVTSGNVDHDMRRQRMYDGLEVVQIGADNGVRKTVILSTLAPTARDRAFIGETGAHFTRRNLATSTVDKPKGGRVSSVDIKNWAHELATSLIIKDDGQQRLAL